MIHTVKGVWALFLAIGFLMLGNGLQGSLLSLRATIEDFGATVTGLIMSSFYLGFLVSSVITPQLISGVGHVRVFAAFASIASTTILLHSLLPVPEIWFFLRFVTGFAFAGLYVVAESWLNQTATNEERGKVFAIYMMTVSGGMATGQYLLPLADPSGHVLFIVVSVLVSIALVPVSLSRSPAPVILETERMGFLELYRLSPLGLIACVLSGAGQGAMLSMGAVYGAGIGLPTAQLALFMSLPLFCVLLFQLPLGAVSDRMDRRYVICAVAGLAAAVAIFAASDLGGGRPILFAAFAVYGSFSMVLYGLSIAHANDAIPSEKMLPASAKLVLAFSIGSVAGPLVVGALMSAAGPSAFFVFGAAVHLAMALFAAYRMMRRPAIAEEDRGEYVILAPRATAVAAAAAIEAAADAAQEEEAEKEPERSE